MKRIRTTRLLVAAAATITLIGGAAGPALADDDPTESLAAAVSDAVAVAASEETTTTDGSTRLDLPATSEGDLVISDEEGFGLTVGLPEEAETGNREEARDGTIIYPGSAGSVDVAIEPIADGARISTIISSADESSTFTYTLGADTTPILNSDGSVDLRRDVTTLDPQSGDELVVSAMVAHVDAPWAVDATGTPIPTHYTVESGDLVQIVDHAAASTVYPVVADPTYTILNWFQVLVKWNRAETAAIAAGGWGSTGLTAVCIAAGNALGGPAVAAVLGALCLGYTAPGVYTAGIAQNSSPKRCLQLTLTNTVVTAAIPVFATYGGSSCK